MVSVGRSMKDESKANYLDMRKIPELKPVTRLAYVHDVNVGTTKYDSGFVKFYLKDCNADVVTAILFDVENFMMSGINAAAFKHKAVEFKCVAQEFRGRLSLVIDSRDGIKVYNGPFEYEKFIGRVDYSLTMLESACCECGEWDGIDTNEWLRCSIDELGRGRTGAFGRLVELAYSSIAPVVNSLNKKESDEMLSAFVVTSDYYFRYLRQKQNTDVIGTLGIYKFLSQVSQRYSESDSKLVFLDCLSAVAGSDKPKHLYAHLIKNAFDNARLTMQMQLQFTSMPLGTKAYVGGVELSKY